MIAKRDTIDMRELSFPLVSLGTSALKNPDITDVSRFISTVRGNTADRITYELYAGIKSQKPSVSEITAGGDFYRPRIEEYLGATDGELITDPAIHLNTIEDDLHTVRIKGLGFSLPAFSELHLTDKYLYDTDEFEAAGVDAYKTLSRELRDKGANRTILLAKNPGDLELETLRGKNYLWATPADTVERIVEYSRDVVLEATAISKLRDLSENYEIRNLHLLNAEKDTLLLALELFDPEYIFLAGYAESDKRETYWKNLSEIRVTVDETW